MQTTQTADAADRPSRPPSRRLLRLEAGADGAPRFCPLGVPLRAELAAWLAAARLPSTVRADIAALLAEPPPPRPAVPGHMENET